MLSKNYPLQNVLICLETILTKMRVSMDSSAVCEHIGLIVTGDLTLAPTTRRFL